MASFPTSPSAAPNPSTRPAKTKESNIMKNVITATLIAIAVLCVVVVSVAKWGAEESRTSAATQQAVDQRIAEIYGDAQQEQAPAPAPAPPPPPKEDVTIKSFSGKGASTMRPFTVQSNWEIQWTADGDYFGIYLYDANGGEAAIGVPANQTGPGPGSSFQARAGTYYIQTNALGSWTIDVVQLGM